ncbi:MULTISPECIES: VOC family protein [unclassified Sphingomonas]|uniref:VOC family protein n=1 Tax=unclassified Sphingomonas TaxID=196159 RepID=UPI0007000052|nr:MULTISPECIES: VOC family protein [unclassified Sphingomonas]KQM28253.1 glyoxalase [Sphingomonas sp. Leaf9]KQM44594.1 glyoxalase [Sphingomonas sp. Leaf11]
MTDKLTIGVHHVGLTVPDIDQARLFFCDVLGFDVVGGKPEYPAVFVSDGRILLTLWRAADPAAARPFDRRANIGLHHLSLAVADDAALDAVWARVGAHADVVVDVAPDAIQPGSATRHFIVFIPGGIRLEFATPFVPD